jgi:phospholipase C
LKRGAYAVQFNDNRIKYFVLLMLENRSFDHMLGFSGIPGIDGLTGAETNPDTTGAPVKVSNDAQYIGDYEPDPGHELFDVNVRIFSNRQATPGTAPPMQGFIQSYFQVCNDPDRAKKVMKCFSPQRLPILTCLAQHYAVCDRWFSFVPGPPLPNRSFAHAATSLGSGRGTSFPRQSAHDLSGVEPAGLRHQDPLPGLDHGAYPQRIAGRSHEILWPLRRFPVSSSHATTTGNPDVWQKTMLLIVYDVHGGLFDHVAPPACQNPDTRNSPAPPFDFTRLGVRVPAVIVSPYIN